MQTDGGSTDQSAGFFFVQEQILDWQFKSSKTDSSTEGERFSGLLKLNRVFQKRLVGWGGRGWGHHVSTELLCPLRSNHTVYTYSKRSESPFFISLLPYNLFPQTQSSTVENKARDSKVKYHNCQADCVQDDFRSLGL